MFVVQVRLLSILTTDKIYSQAASLEKDLPELAVVKSEFICSEYRQAGGGKCSRAGCDCSSSLSLSAHVSVL